MRANKRPKPARGKALGILNPYGDLWTYETFSTEAAARKYIKDFWGQSSFIHTKTDLDAFKVIPVRVTVSATNPARVGRRGSADRDGASKRHMLSVQATDKPLQAEGAPAAEVTFDPDAHELVQTAQALIMAIEKHEGWGDSMWLVTARAHASVLVQDLPDALSPPAAEGKEEARALLEELVAIVRGECPRLLSEDSGGSAELSIRIDDALSHTPAPADHFVDVTDMISTPAPAAEPVATKICNRCAGSGLALGGTCWECGGLGVCK